MFVLRAVCGTHKGEYYTGFDSDKMSPTWSNDIAAAEQVKPQDAAGIVMAMIDGPRFVVVPERLPSATDEECAVFADFAARGMFQAPSEAMKEIIAKVIRSSPDAQFGEQPTDMPPTGDYMSVWEWLSRAMAASKQI